jgi:hypothetical protein
MRAVIPLTMVLASLALGAAAQHDRGAVIEES